MTRDEPVRPDDGVEVRLVVGTSPTSALPARCLQSIAETNKKPAVPGLSDTPVIRDHPAHPWWHLRGGDIGNGQKTTSLSVSYRLGGLGLSRGKSWCLEEQV